jgi:hypothetical protein
MLSNSNLLIYFDADFELKLALLSLAKDSFLNMLEGVSSFGTKQTIVKANHLKQNFFSNLKTITCRKNVFHNVHRFSDFNAVRVVHLVHAVHLVHLGENAQKISRR